MFQLSYQNGGKVLKYRETSRRDKISQKSMAHFLKLIIALIRKHFVQLLKV